MFCSGAAIIGTNKTDRVIGSPVSVSTLTVEIPKCLNDVCFSPNAEMLIPSLCFGVILDFCASLLDINECCAPSSNKMFACAFVSLTVVVFLSFELIVPCDWLV